MGKTYTLTMAAEYLGIKRRTFYDMIADGRFSVDSIPRLRPRRWNQEALDKWRDSVEVKTT